MSVNPIVSMHKSGGGGGGGGGGGEFNIKMVKVVNPVYTYFKHRYYYKSLHL